MLVVGIFKTKMDIKSFIEEHPLYKKSYSKTLILPHVLHDYQNSIFCNICKKETTHTLKILEKVYDSYRKKSDFDGTETIIKTDGINIKATIKSLNFPFEDLVIYQNFCNLCSQKTFEVAIKFSFKSNEDGEIIDYILQKIGMFPVLQLVSNRDVFNYLNKEDRDCYSKAEICRFSGYGIASFAYYRRIIENEIKRIINDLITYKVENWENIKSKYDAFLQNHQMEKLITETNDFIPASIKIGGSNPIKLLYKQLSGGIHEFSEDECLDKAESIHILLSHVVAELNKQKSINSELKDAISKLSK